MAAEAPRPPTPPGGRGHTEFMAEYAARIKALATETAAVPASDAKTVSSNASGVDAIVVLGLKLEAGGKVPLALTLRLTACAKYYAALPDPKPPVVVTGGDTLGCGTTEAAAMAGELAKHLSPPPSASADAKAAAAPAAAEIVTEPNALDTVQNAIFTRRIGDARGWRRYVIVTSAFHAERAHCVFRAVFGDDARYSFASAADTEWATLYPAEHAARCAREKQHLALLNSWLGEYKIAPYPPKPQAAQLTTTPPVPPANSACQLL